MVHDAKFILANKEQFIGEEISVSGVFLGANRWVRLPYSKQEIRKFKALIDEDIHLRLAMVFHSFLVDSENSLLGDFADGVRRGFHLPRRYSDHGIISEGGIVKSTYLWLYVTLGIDLFRSGKMFKQNAISLEDMLVLERIDRNGIRMTGPFQLPYKFACVVTGTLIRSRLPEFAIGISNIKSIVATDLWTGRVTTIDF